MRKSVLAVAWLMIATPALACVCVGPVTPDERRERARDIAARAAAVVEVELVEPMNYEAMRPEVYRVVKLHFGAAPVQFSLAREFSRTPKGQVQMAMTSCDVVPPAGERTTVILYATPQRGSYMIGGTCDHLFINTPGAVDLVRDEAGKLAPSSERG